MTITWTVLKGATSSVDERGNDMIGRKLVFECNGVFLLGAQLSPGLPAA